MKVGVYRMEVDPLQYHLMQSKVLSDLARGSSIDKEYYFPSGQRPIPMEQGKFNCITYPYSIGLHLPAVFMTGSAETVAPYFGIKSKKSK